MALATVLLAALASPAAWSRTVLDLDALHQPVLLQDWGDYWVDTAGQMSVQQLSAAKDIRWQPTQRQTIYPVTTGGALWIRFSVPPAPLSTGCRCTRWMGLANGISKKQVTRSRLANGQSPIAIR